MSQQDDVWIVIPAFDESSIIASTVKSVLATYPKIVVVDDGSTDDTEIQALKSGAIVVRHLFNLGQGAALQTGLDFALRHGAQYLVTFDADGQHKTEDIGVLIETQSKTQCDVVIGSRFIGKAEGLATLRRWILKAAVCYTRISTGLPLTDAHNGLRLFTREAAQKIQLHQNGMSHASEIVDQLGKLGLKVAEAPVTIIYTEYSLAKGQKLSNSFRILADLLAARLER